MNDALFFLVILIFLFVLWVYSGGPMHPISFSGPYLTPITNVNQESQGYGPSANRFYGTGSTISRYSNSTTQAAADTRSPFNGSAHLAGGNPQATSASDEYVTITASNDLDITGWQLVSAKNGTQLRIPQGYRGSSSTKRDVSVESGDEVYINTRSRKNTDDYSSSSSVWHVYLGSRNDIWESHDTVTLLDANGKVVDQYTY